MSDSVALTCLIILKSPGWPELILFISLSFCVLKNIHDPALQGLHHCCLSWQRAVSTLMAERTCSSCHLLSLCFSHMSSLPRSTSQWQLCPLHVSVIPLAVKDLFFSTSLHFPCPGLLKGSLGLACAAEGRKATSSLCSCVLVQVPVCEVTEHLSDPGGVRSGASPCG